VGDVEGDAAETADSPVRAKRKDTRSAMAKKLGWGAPRRRRKPKGAAAGAKAPAKRPSPRPSAAAKPRPPKSAPNQSPAAAAREAEQLSDEALARALQQEELGTRKRTRKPPDGPAVANDAGTTTLAHTVYTPLSAPTLPLMLNDTRPYRVVSRAADSASSPGASQPRGVALPSHSVRDSGSS